MHSWPLECSHHYEIHSDNDSVHTLEDWYLHDDNLCYKGWCHKVKFAQ